MIRDLVGKRFGRLLVVCKTDKRSRRQIIWRCRCDCGKYNNVKTGDLISENTRSCGCLRAEYARVANLKHGDRRQSFTASLYARWHSMKARCIYKKNQAFKYYGGRGITLCPEWSKSYIAFKKWALANGYKPGLTIDRINNDGNYEPSNCRFITQSENTKKRPVKRRS